MKIAILGFGSVGQALARLLLERQEELYLRYGFAPRVVAIADSKSLALNPEGLDLRLALQCKRSTGRVGHPCQGITVAEIADKTGFDALVELTPTNPLDGEPARTHILEALGRGKHVVTANKGPLALAFSELKMRAEQSGSMLRYSAAVGGGTPILDFGEACARAEPITEIRGVLNSTSTFILSQMEERGVSLDAALAEARRLGLAEADPSLDLDGIDTACKAVILANHLMGMNASLRDVGRIDGIRDVSPERIREAAARNMGLRIVGIVRRRIEVRLVELGRDNPLFAPDMSNVVAFRCKYSGEKVIRGRGAGGIPTACGVLRDLIHVHLAVRGRWGAC